MAKTYMDVIYFHTRAVNGEKKRAPRRIGYAWHANDGVRINLKLTEIPVGNWDGSLVLEPQAPREGGSDESR